MSSSSVFTDFAAPLCDRIDGELRAYVEMGDDCPTRLREAVAYSLLAPGKRLRPLLVLMGAEACGGTIEAALPPACAVEMVHAYSLIHDDLPAMDNDDLRRGRPTCHKVFGEALAILAGDALLAMAFEVLAKRVEPASVAVACCAALAEAAGPCQLVGGQADDILQSTGCPNEATHTVGQLYAIHQRKTGAVILASLRLGALVSHAGEAQIAALMQYGQSLGLAFQITDDLLDIRSNEAATGKRVGKDAKLGKLTFPSLLGVDESTRRAEQLIAQACEALVPLRPRTHALQLLAHYVLERNR